jgi:putative lipoprotein
MSALFPTAAMLPKMGRTRSVAGGGWMRGGTVALLAAMGLGGCMAMPDLPVIEGTAQYRERMALPPDAVFDVYLEDVSKADAPSIVVSAQEIDPAGQPPIRFSVPYDPKKIDQAGRYALRATVTVGDEVLFATTDSYPVLTQGNGTSADLLLQRAGGAATAAAPATVPALGGPEWTLTTLNGQPVAPAEGGHAPNLTFDTAQGRFHGSGGCNRIGGGFQLVGDDGDLDIGQIISTKMACPNEGVPSEQAFLDALAKVDGYAVQGHELRLSGDGVEMTFRAR